jgi:hypothetical protein
MSAGTVDGAIPPRTTDPDPDAGLAPPPSRRWRRRLGLAAASVVVAALVAGWALGATYQPVAFGGFSRAPLGPHLISKHVNTVGGMQGQAYLPPQPSARGSFLISLSNDGPLPVTIESLSLLPPGMPASAIHYGRPFRIDGPPTYTLEYLSYRQRQIAPRGLAGAVLAPGESVDVRIPIRTAPCWAPNSGWQMGTVWVSTRSLLWSHHVAISWTDPNDPSQGAIISEEGYSSGAIRGVVCPR